MAGLIEWANEHQLVLSIVAVELILIALVVLAWIATGASFEHRGAHRYYREIDAPVRRHRREDTMGGTRRISAESRSRSQLFLRPDWRANITPPDPGAFVAFTGNPQAPVAVVEDPFEDERVDTTSVDLWQTSTVPWISEPPVIPGQTFVQTSRKDRSDA